MKLLMLNRIAPKRVHFVIFGLNFKTDDMSRFEKGPGYFLANWGLFIGFGVIFHILFHLPLGGIPSGFMWLWDAGGWSRVGAVGAECILTYVTVASFIHAYKRW